MTIRAQVEGIGTLEFPDGTSDDVVQSTVMRMVNENKPPSVSSGALAQLGQGATLGFMDEGQAAIGAGYAKAFGGKATENISFKELYEQGRDEIRADLKGYRDAHPKTALGLEIAGGLATGGGATKSLYGSLGKLGARSRNAITGALPGAIAGAGFSEGETAGDVALDTAIGAGLGGAIGVAAPAVINRVSDAFRQIVRKPNIQVFDDAGQFTKDAIDELDNMVSSGKITQDDAQGLIRQSLVDESILTPEQAQRFNLFSRRGVAPIRADVTQKTSDFLEKQSALKRSGPVAERVAQQDTEIGEAVAKGIDNINGFTTNALETSGSAFRVVDDVVKSLDDAVGVAYNAAREASRGQPLVTLDKFAKAISDNRGSEEATGGVVSFARQILKNKGLVKVGNEIDINKRGPRTQGNQLKKLTVSEAEEIRQGLNSLHDSVSPMGRRLIHDLKNSIDDDVERIVGADLFEDARGAKTFFHKTIEKARRNKFDRSSCSFLEDVIYNKIPEEKIFPKLMTARDDDFLKFRDFLDSSESGQQAWKNIKAQALRDALDKALGTMGKGEGGRQVWNARSFKNAFNNIRKTKKYEALFNADERALIDDISEIGRLRVPPSLVQQGKGPTEVAVDQLRGKILRAVPWVGDGAQDLLDAIATRKTDMRVLNPAKETVKQLTR